MNMGLLLLFLLIGFILGYFQPFPRRLFKLAEYLTMGGLIILLLTMGAKIGVDERIISKLDQIGLQALILALSTVVGSVLLVKLYLLKFHLEIKREEPGAEIKEKIKEEIRGEGDIAAGEANESHNKMTLIIITSILTGILAGLYLFPESIYPYLDRVTSYALAVLLVGVGIDIGLNRQVFRQVKVLGWQLLVLPLLIAAGSIGGAMVLGFFLGLTGQESAAVAAGFGWYSLSAVLIAKIYSVELGSLAFLCNVFRELITFILLPLIVKYLGQLVSIAPGGATTMDVTLPLVKKTAGEEAVIPAFISGVILSILVPILVPLFLKL